MDDGCDCGLPLDPPERGDYWWPTVDFEPKLHEAHGVVRFGEHPSYRRAVRDGDQWRERGASVDGIGTPSTIPWHRVGLCWAGTDHAVVAVLGG